MPEGWIIRHNKPLTLVHFTDEKAREVWRKQAGCLDSVRLRLTGLRNPLFPPQPLCLQHELCAGSLSPTSGIESTGSSEVAGRVRAQEMFLVTKRRHPWRRRREELSEPLPQTLEGHWLSSFIHFRSNTWHLEATDYSCWFNDGFHLLKGLKTKGPKNSY